jgi:hypothetical protein
MSVGLTGLSISVAHFDPALNDQIMRLPRSWSGMSEDTLRTIAQYASDTFTPRLSCVMTAEGITNVTDIFRYLEWGRSLGYRRFIFRTCSAIPDEFQKDTAFSAYNESNAMSIEPIVEEIGARPGVIQTYRQRKSDSKVDVFSWEGLTFDIDESSEEVDPDPKVRRLNVMPDGVAYTSWIDPMSVLFEDDRETARRSMAREFAARG